MGPLSLSIFALIGVAESDAVCVDGVPRQSTMGTTKENTTATSGLRLSRRSLSCEFSDYDGRA